MSSVLAQSGPIIDDGEPPVAVTGGAQSILAPLRTRASYWPQAAAIAIYAALLTVAALHRLTPAPPPEEEAVELVMLPPPAPAAEEPPPPVEEQPPPVAEEPPPLVEEPPPPPVAEVPAVAPVEPKPIPKPKPPPPKPKVVEHKPVEKPRPAPPKPAAPTPAPARPAAAPPPANAVPSGYFNQVASRVARVANSNPLRGPGRVGYRIVIAPSGSVISASISSSGRPDLDAAARRAIAGPFPSFGGTRPVAVSGGVRYQ
jgi:protein TonB